jgi:hypothetical protein
LNAVRRLCARDTSGNDGNVVFAQAEGIFQMGCYLTEPGLTRDYGPYPGPWFILDVNSLFVISIVMPVWV